MTIGTAERCGGCRRAAIKHFRHFFFACLSFFRGVAVHKVQGSSVLFDSASKSEITGGRDDALEA